MPVIRVLLADDQVLFVESLRVVLETRASDMKVVGLAHDGSEVIKLAEEEQPDVILMDVRMPGTDGVAAAKTLQEQMPAVRVIMLTTYDDDDYVFSAMRYGAVGYLLKDMPPEDLIDAVRSAGAGQILMSPRVATKIASRGFASTPNRSGSGHDDSMLSFRARHMALSDREKDIFNLLVNGYQNIEIAHMLSLAVQTVKNHVSDIYFKMGIHNRGQLMRSAKQLEITE